MPATLFQTKALSFPLVVQNPASVPLSPSSIALCGCTKCSTLALHPEFCFCGSGRCFCFSMLCRDGSSVQTSRLSVKQDSECLSEVQLRVLLVLLSVLCLVFEVDLCVAHVHIIVTAVGKTEALFILDFWNILVNVSTVLGRKRT